MARILLADDDAGTRDLVSRALTADGHEVAIATDGLDALAQDRAVAREVRAAVFECAIDPVDPDHNADSRLFSSASTAASPRARPRS